MNYHPHLPGFHPSHLVAAFPWSALPAAPRIIDVGGGLGHVSEALLASNARAICIVQDDGSVVAKAKEKQLPRELEGRISFVAHDFFLEQDIRNADVFLLRLVLHNWSDKQAVNILRALAPALKPGSKIIINDRVIPAKGTMHYLVEREAR